MTDLLNEVSNQPLQNKILQNKPFPFPSTPTVLFGAFHRVKINWGQKWIVKFGNKCICLLSYSLYIWFGRFDSLSILYVNSVVPIRGNRERVFVRTKERGVKDANTLKGRWSARLNQGGVRYAFYNVIIHAINFRPRH